MKTIIDTINKRHSVRCYSDKAIETELIDKIIIYLAENNTGPFGSNVRFDIVDGSSYDPSELKNFGTYGMIKNAKIYIAGVVNKNVRAMEDYGYCMEKNILMLTSLGISSCWIGGSLNRSVFASKTNAESDELLPGITPIGYADGKKTFAENMMTLSSTVAGNKSRRKKPEELFFDKSIDCPLDLTSCGLYATVLQAVIAAPSAMNGQPWRIVRDADGAYHLFLKEKDTRFNHSGEIKFQRLDMGIAMCHFELSALELGIKGVWNVKNPSIDMGDLNYIVSWAEEK